MKKIVAGILAHVDAGKTTLSEAMLYRSGDLRKLGRVDSQDTFLDTHSLEKKRGITIFSKQARLHLNDFQITLLDTPGHVDFSAEMERTLQVLDYAILVISGADGVQGHTRTLWKLLKNYQIPTFVFINKMDQPDTDSAKLMENLSANLGEGFVNFSNYSRTPEAVISPEFVEELAVCDDKLLEQYLENPDDTSFITDQLIAGLIANRKTFPCFFGSALRIQGVDELLDGIQRYTIQPEYETAFGARVYKIGRDEQDQRLTYMKITGGSLKVKEVIESEKVNQIRLYSGEKYETATEIYAGEICAVTGLDSTFPGQGLGIEEGENLPILEPVLNYQVILPEGCDPKVALPKLRKLEEEEPELHVVWLEQLQEIQMQVMGKVQLEIIQDILFNRFDLPITFGIGNIVYKETISNVVEGVGHFEPLRHYAEVHLLMEPAEPGTGLEFAAVCSEDTLAKNWQRLILTHLQEKEHVGVLTGSPITDMRITLVAGRAHLKHTEGGDFRQATYRAIRHGLMQAESVLLEPCYAFRLEIPIASVGRAMTDLERMQGTFTLEQNDVEHDVAVLTGKAPVSLLQDYQTEITAYSAGRGHIFCEMAGYMPCHNSEEVIQNIGYDTLADLRNTPDSVFCSHGAGMVVPWEQVEYYMHVDSGLKLLRSPETAGEELVLGNSRERFQVEFLDKDEIDAILNRNSNANKREDRHKRHGWSGKGKSKPQIYDPMANKRSKPSVKKGNYLLVDGYNVIFAWDSLKELAEVNIDSARDRLLDIMCNYQAIRGMELIVVFDAYRVKGHQTEILDYQNIHVVYTREAETADHYIECFAHENGVKYNITVATSDGLEQIIIRGAGCGLISSREFEKEVENAENHMREAYLEQAKTGKIYLGDMAEILMDDEGES